MAGSYRVSGSIFYQSCSCSAAASIHAALLGLTGLLHSEFDCGYLADMRIFVKAQDILVILVKQMGVMSRHQRLASRKAPQPAMDDRPTATRLCCLRRSRIFWQPVLPARISLPVTTSLQPLHTSGSHSKPASSCSNDFESICERQTGLGSRPYRHICMTYWSGDKDNTEGPLQLLQGMLI